MNHITNKKGEATAAGFRDKEGEEWRGGEGETHRAQAYNTVIVSGKRRGKGEMMGEDPGNGAGPASMKVAIRKGRSKNDGWEVE